MKKEELTQYRSILESFREDYRRYMGTVNRSFGTSNEHYRNQLQERVVKIADIVARVHGGGKYTRKSETYSFYSTMAYALDASAVTNDNWVEVKSHVERIINEAIGCIDNGIFPSRVIKPVLPIKDETLKKRCSDILNAPGNFDRVIREATLILEERLRTSVPYEKLCELIPLAKEQVGEPLANKLLSPINPVIVVSDKQQERNAFHKMVVGIVAYLRNPSHHSLSDDTEWSLAWSVVGIIDSILSELDNSYISGEKPKTKRQEKKK